MDLKIFLPEQELAEVANRERLSSGLPHGVYSRTKILPKHHCMKEVVPLTGIQGRTMRLQPLAGFIMQLRG